MQAIRPFPLRVLRPVTCLLQVAFSNEGERQLKQQELIHLYQCVQAHPIQTHTQWEQVESHAEFLGALLHELDLLAQLALTRSGCKAEDITVERERLYHSPSLEKIEEVIAAIFRRCEGKA